MSSDQAGKATQRPMGKFASGRQSSMRRKRAAYCLGELAAARSGVSGHLDHPRLGGMFGRAGEGDTPLLQMKKKQYIVGG